MTSSKLNVIFWNSRSIRNKYIELFNYLVLNNVDICLLSETWLKSNIKVTHSTYNCIRIDREDRPGGGVAILIKNNLKYEILPKINADSIENVGIEILNESFEKIKLYSVYFPGGRSNNSNRSKFKSGIKKILSVTGSFIICGDLNARHKDWGCLRANSWGNVLSDLTTVLPFVIQNSSNPTYIPAASNANPSTLDLLLTNIPDKVSQPVAMNNLGSDHLPVKFSISFDCLQTENFVLDLKNTNWKTYKRSLKSKLENIDINIDNIINSTQIDQNVDIFSKYIINSFHDSTPKIKPKYSNHLKLPSNIINLIKIRNKHRRDWIRHRQQSDFSHLNYYSTLINKEIFNFKNKNWNVHLSNLEKHSKPFWNIAKATRKKIPNIPPIHKDGIINTLNIDKANAFASQFLCNHQVSAHMGDSLNNHCVESTVLNLDSLNIELPSIVYIPPDNIKDLIKTLRPRKASGHDEISNDMLKNLPNVAIKFFTFIINSCLKLQYFPSIWKTAKVIPISKPGKDAKNVESYRPISLLSSLSKIFEKVLKDKLWTFINQHNVIPSEQFGFRSFHSTTHQIKRISNHVKQNFSFQKSTALVLLDVEKAFDSVWHNGLIFKLIQHSFPIYLIKLIQSFLSRRLFCVCINNEYSDLFEIPAGVPQGSVLGPLLYIIFCADIPKYGLCEYAYYADDTGIYVSDVLGEDVVCELQKGIDSLCRYFFKWKIKINSTKTQSIFFTRKRSPVFLPSTKLKVNGHEVSWSDNVKYLGIYLDKKLTFKHHTDQIKSKFNLAIKLMYPLINRKSDLSLENKIIIVKTIFQAIILYACPVWEDCANVHIKKLQICQNKLLKMCLKLPWHYSTNKLHDEAKVKLIKEQTIKITDRFKLLCGMSDNPNIYELY